jgi:anti-sigma B factor antagonist
MDIQFAEIDGVKKVILSGRLDTAGVDMVGSKFSAGVVAGGRPAMVDLSRVEFLASLGVRMLISAARALALNGGKLVLFAPTAPVMEVIEVMGLDEIIPTVSSESEALARLAE